MSRKRQNGSVLGKKRIYYDAMNTGVHDMQTVYDSFSGAPTNREGYNFGFGTTQGLYTFTSFTFTRAGGTGQFGQSLANILASSDYDTGTYPWLANTAFFSMASVTGVQLWTVPESGSYTIQARGAPGGSVGTTLYTGGIGANIQGTFNLIQGDKLEILVGHPGGNRSGTTGGASGGGGSFVVKENGTTTSDILVIAGGGGGAEFWSGRNTSDHGGSGQLSTITGGAGGDSTQTVGSYGQAAPGSGGGARARGGANGYGGGGSVAGGGGGFFDRGGTGNQTASVGVSNSQCGYGYLTGTGYTASLRSTGGRGGGSGWQSTNVGGFGGGGGCQTTSGYGGGGGGYSGGGGGNFGNSLQGNGGGGGSYNSGSNKVESAFSLATHPGSLTGYDSFVTITRVA